MKNKGFTLIELMVIIAIIGILISIAIPIAEKQKIEKEQETKQQKVDSVWD